MSNVDVSIHTISLKDRLNPDVYILPTEKICSSGSIGSLFVDLVTNLHTNRDDALKAIEEATINQLAQNPVRALNDVNPDANTNEPKESPKKFLLKVQEPIEKEIRANLQAVYGFIEVCSNGDPAHITRASNVAETFIVEAEDFYHRSYFYILLMPANQDTSYIFLESKNGRGGLGGLMLNPLEQKIRTSCDHIVKVGAFSTSQVFSKILDESSFEKLSFYKRKKQYSREDGTSDIEFEVKHKTTIKLPGRKKRSFPWQDIKNKIFKEEAIILPGYETLDYDRRKVTLTLPNGKSRTIDLANPAKGFIPNYELENVLHQNAKPDINSLVIKTTELFDDLMAQL